MSPVNCYLILNSTILKVPESFVNLGVNMDLKLTFEYQIRSVVSSAARSMGIVRRPTKIFDTSEVLATYFRAYVLSRLEYCDLGCGSADESYLKLIDGVVRRAEALCGESLCNLGHRMQVSCLCMMYKIYKNPDPALSNTLLPMEYDTLTRGAASAHEHYL